MLFSVSLIRYMLETVYVYIYIDCRRYSYENVREKKIVKTYLYCNVIIGFEHGADRVQCRQNVYRTREYCTAARSGWHDVLSNVNVNTRPRSDLCNTGIAFAVLCSPPTSEQKRPRDGKRGNVTTFPFFFCYYSVRNSFVPT